MKATEVARKALSACLVISADSTDIQSMFSVNGFRSFSTRLRSAAERSPTTTRSGRVKAWMAFPSRKFSGEYPRVTFFSG